jgi:hypothetical protein
LLGHDSAYWDEVYGWSSEATDFSLFLLTDLTFSRYKKMVKRAAAKTVKDNEEMDRLWKGK